jgi:hypothetical protein
MSASYLLWSGAQAEKCPEGEPCLTPLERRCRLLLRAYPAWYRCKRSGEILDTLLEASPPGRRWPSFRDARALVMAGLRVRSALVWCLSIVWAGLGTAGAGYIFFLSTHVPAIPTYSSIPCWVGETDVIIAAAELGGAAWLLLTIPVLVAGLIRLRGSELRAAAWIVAWISGIGLMASVALWQTSAPATEACDDSSGCILTGYSHAVVSWRELAICAAWLALGAAMTLILARPRQGYVRYQQPFQHTHD